VVNGGVAGGGGADEYRWDFFVSHASEDLGWARWLVWELANAGYRAYLLDWDAQPGSGLAGELPSSPIPIPTR
jgi:hypothetical protein